MFQARPKIAIALLTAISAIGLLIIPTVAMGASSTTYRLNAGGPPLEGQPQWTRDSSERPSSYLTSPQSKTAFTNKSVDTTHSSLPTGTPSTMFMDTRNGPGRGALSYSFPVTAGDHEVRLYFAEIRTTQMALGARVMNVALENSTVLSNYDVFKAVGGHRGVMKSFTVTSDKTLDVRISATKSRPVVAGIEIVSLDTEPTPDPSMSMIITAPWPP